MKINTGHNYTSDTDESYRHLRIQDSINTDYR